MEPLVALLEPGVTVIAVQMPAHGVLNHSRRFPTLGRRHGAGRDPVAAITMLVRLRLFPAVFPAPSPVAEALGSDYGAPCLAAMTAAHALLQVGKTRNPGPRVTRNPVPVLTSLWCTSLMLCRCDPDLAAHSLLEARAPAHRLLSCPKRAATALAWVPLPVT